MNPVDKIVPLLRRWDHGVHSEYLAKEIVKALRLTEERRTVNAYDETVDEHSWVTPWEPIDRDRATVSHAEEPDHPVYAADVDERTEGNATNGGAAVVVDG